MTVADVILAERPLSYKDFILSKSHSGGDHGFKPISLPSCLFDFQSAMVEWALRKGIGFELKPSYFRQAVKNVQAALDGIRFDMQTADLFDEEVAS